MPRKPSQVQSWSEEAATLLRQQRTHEQRVQMNEAALRLFWAEFGEKLSHCPSTSDPWQLFKSACSGYIGPNASRF